MRKDLQDLMNKSEGKARRLLLSKAAVRAAEEISGFLHPDEVPLFVWPGRSGGGVFVITNLRTIYWGVGDPVNVSIADVVGASSQSSSSLFINNSDLYIKTPGAEHRIPLYQSFAGARFAEEIMKMKMKIR